MDQRESSDSIDSAEEFLTRRRMMASGAAMVGAGLAGCSDGSDGGDGTLGDAGDDSTGSDGSSGDQTTITTFMRSIPGEMNFNSWVPSCPWTPTWILLEPVIRFYVDGSVSLEMLSEDWSYDSDSQEATVPFTDDFCWWNGD